MKKRVRRSFSAGGNFIAFTIMSIALFGATALQGMGGKPKDEYDSTTLHYAAKLGHKDRISVLVKSGVDVNAKNKFGRTALHWGAEEGCQKTVLALIVNGADLHALDDTGQTALHNAAIMNHDGVVLALVRCGANVHSKDKMGDTPLDFVTNAKLKKQIEDAKTEFNEGIWKLIKTALDTSRKDKDDEK